MLRPLCLTGCVCALLLTTVSDASAGWLFRRHQAPAVQTYYPPPYAPIATELPSTSASDSIEELAKKLTKEEQQQYREMDAKGWFNQLVDDAGKVTEDTSEEEADALVEAEVVKYLSGTSDSRKAVYEYFKKETAPLTDEEIENFQAMVKANKVKVSAFPGYAGMRASKRQKAYEAFKKAGGAAPEMTPEEFAQFHEIVKARKAAKKGGIDDVAKFYGVFQSLTPADRKALYDAKDK